jgi:hypothetical protein
MTGRVTFAVALALALALWAWRAELFTVSRPGDVPRPLESIGAADRRRIDFDVVLPAVPVGMQRLRPADGVILIHYWAPWERHAGDQAARLDSLRHLDDLVALRATIVCFDPFPSVARYVARRRLRVGVLLDTEHRLREALPCPSVPFTYVLDRSGGIAVAQAGEVDWLDPRTRRTLTELMSEPVGDRPVAPPS